MSAQRKFQTLRVVAAELAAMLGALTFVFVTAPAATASIYVESGVAHFGVVTGGGSSVSADGCVQRGWSFQAYITSDGLPNVDYFASTSNVCWGEHTWVTGQTYDAVIETTALRSARVVATVPLIDRDGQPAGDVRIDNTFTAFGRAEVGRSKIVFSSDGMRLQAVSNGQWRQALSSGALPLDFAAITSNTSSTLLIIHDAP
jgi:hypothetical protein